MFEPHTVTPTAGALTEDQWDAVKDHFDCRRKRKHTIRGIINAILYVIDNDIHWRMLPRQFAPWQTVYYYYDKWKKDGTWSRVLAVLPEDIRQKAMASAFASPYPTVDVHVIKTHAQPEKAHIHSIQEETEAKPGTYHPGPMYPWMRRIAAAAEEEQPHNQAA